MDDREGWAPLNPYPQDPFRVTVFRALARRPVRTFYFLGDAPKNVLAAARRGAPRPRLDDPKQPGRWPATAWPEKDRETLARHFGKGWQGVLVPDLSFVLGRGGEGAALVVGGDGSDDALPADEDGGDGGDEGGGFGEGGFGDLSSLNRLDEDGAVIIAEEDLGKGRPDGAGGRPGGERPPDEGDHADDGPPDTVFTDLAAFPEDSLADIGEKIYLATGIPPGRQHLFFPPAAGGSPWLPYRLLVSGAPRPTDIRRLGDSEGVHVAELPIDEALAGQAEQGEVFVEALDDFRLVSAAGPGGRPLHHVYVADLAELARADGGRRRALAAAVSDPLRASLLYRGLVLKYWPKLSFEAMVEYFSGVRLDEFPQLAPPAAPLRARYALQRELLARTYANQEAVLRRYLLPPDGKDGKEGAAGPGAGGVAARALAVTRAEILVEPYSVAAQQAGGRTRVNVRNILDFFETSVQWPAVAARFFLTSSVRGGRQDVTVNKSHVSAAPGGNHDAEDIQREARKTLRRSSLRIVVRPRAGAGGAGGAGGEGAPTGLVDGAWLKGRARLVVFTLLDDGAYSLESTWSEDERLTPAQVVETLSGVIAPLVDAINRMGSLVFPTGGRLHLPAAATGANVYVRGMSVAAFWPRALTDGAFRALKERWRDYERAGFVAIRGLQQAGAFASQATKGIVAYDPLAIERTIVVSQVTDSAGRTRTVREITERTQNTYSHLTDPGVAQRWQAVYPGRPVRFYHRTSDVKVEFDNLGGDELRWLWRLVFVFLDGLASGPGKVPGVLHPSQRGEGRRDRNTLRSLQDRDPVLYDLRKYDAKATVYSVLCQKPRPPVILTAEEAGKLSARRRKGLVEYWNFTEGQKAYYECANPKFPHLSFLEGRHPQGYGLPCCQKTAAFPGSRRDLANQYYLQQFAEGPGKAAAPSVAELMEVSSRHVLSYGKRIAPGRTATLARFFERELFFQTLEAGQEYRLLGVAQSLPAIPQAGFFFAAAAVVDETPDAVAKRFVWTVANMGESFRGLVDGRVGDLFADGAALADAIKTTAATGEEPAAGGIFTPFSPGGRASEVWEPLVEELLQICYGAYLLFVDDADGSAARVAVDAGANAVEKLGGGGGDVTPFGVIFRIGQPEGKRNAGGTYPLVILESPAGGRGGAEDGEGGEDGEDGGGGGGGERRGGGCANGRPAQTTTRSLFSRAGAGAGAGEVLLDALRGENDTPRWDLDALATLLKGAKGYRPAAKYVGRRDLCYAVLLEAPGAKAPLYVPVAYCHHSPDDAISRAGAGGGGAVAARFGPRPADEDLAPRAATLAFLALLAGRKKAPAGGAEPLAALRAAGGKYVGVQARLGGELLNFYHRPEAAAPRGLPTLALPDSPRKIDAAIFAQAGRAAAARREAPPALEAGAQRGVYLTLLYRLFLSEFVSAIYRNRNAGVRALLVETFRKRNGSLEDLAEIIVTAHDDEENMQTDVQKLQDILVCGRKGRTRKGKAGDWFACMLSNTYFAFDLLPLFEIRRAAAPEAARRVRAVMDGRVRFMGLDAIVAAGHAAALLRGGVYTSCHDWPRPRDGAPTPCVVEADGAGSPARFLPVPKERYEALVGLVVAEVQNSRKWDSFVFQTSGVIDDLDFVQRPAESIEIRV